MNTETSEIILFFGRFHPLILHLPIGFLVMAFVLEGMSRLKRFKKYKPVVGLVLLLGTISAVVSAILGYMLSQEGGYNEELLFFHQWTGIALTFTATTALALYQILQIRPSAALDKFYVAFMILMMVSLTMAGHFGGSLTHGSDYLTHYMPNGIRKVVGLPPRSNTELKKITNLDEALVFDDIIYPILDAHCISCHNESKSKGGLMLHTQQTIMKGGEGGAVLLAGSPEQSEIIRLINLPKIDDDHMPPSGKNQLSNEQIDLLDWWIREGASFNKTVAEINVDKKVQEILNTLVDPDANKSEVEILLASEIKPAKRQTLVSFHEKGLKVLPLAAKMNWLQVKVSQNQSADSLVTTGLNEITDQLTWLDLGNTDATDKSLSSIGELKNLTRLHLENTLVTDQGLQNLEKLKYLEYLNLFGTKITDKGITELSGLKNLRKLYVWQTGVSKEGIHQLLKSLPELEVYTGVEIGENPASGDENI